MKNAFSIDLEDWFCTYNLSSIIKKEEWQNQELRVYNSTWKILNLLDKYNIKATFFVLGWIAEKVPELIKDIENHGHEIALHGYNHSLLTHLSPEEFENDLKKVITALEKCNIKNPIYGFRAPSFTIVKETLWALKILEKYNLKYDSSIFPINYHPDYGIPDAPLEPYKITENLYEVPMSCIKIFGKRLPCSGGAYFRILPYCYIKYCIKKINSSGRPVIFYFHPWEIDPDQPKMKIKKLKSFRQYHNLEKTEEKLVRLFQDFEFTSIKEILKLK